MSTLSVEVERNQRVCCLGHVYKAAFVYSLITIAINVIEIAISLRRTDFITIPAPVVSLLCYVFILIALWKWWHWCFYPEFFLNVVALPIKIILASWLLINSIDKLEDKLGDDDRDPKDLSKDLIHMCRAVFILASVCFEIYVFRIAQQAHVLMKLTTLREGQRKFNVRKFVTAHDVLPPTPVVKVSPIVLDRVPIREETPDVVVVPRSPTNASSDLFV